MTSERDTRLQRAEEPAAEALRLHGVFRGKIQTALKCPIRSASDFAIWYTPGVAAPCRAIQANASLSFEYTNRANTIAIVTNGTRVLGLGDIGPEAAMPVMEGKALLFKYLGGVDAVPLCLRTRDPEELVHTLELLEPSFGGVNLEDIAQPRCFRVLDGARRRLRIPVWHDDQQGTAAVVLAAVWNALEIVGKKLGEVRVAMIGAGAAGVACTHLLHQAGIDLAASVVCDSRGTLHQKRADIEAVQAEYPEKWHLCRKTNADVLTGGIEDALRGADVCIAFSQSGPGVIRPAWIKRMAKDAIVFACANPVPEIWPWEALDARARVVATGRSDFPNQLNNSLCFPGMFRGVLDVGASALTDGMALAAAREISAVAKSRGLREDAILPRMDDLDLVPRVAATVGLRAMEQGLARVHPTKEELLSRAREMVLGARAASERRATGGGQERAG